MLWIYIITEEYFKFIFKYTLTDVKLNLMKN